ncbi:MAG: AsmA family protein [Candidatus Margulisiibacteriota bacterium]
MKRTVKYICAAIIVLVILLFVLWGSLNYYFIPKVILPEVVKRLEQASQNGPLSVKIQRIEYYPHQGFVIKDIVFLVNFRGQKMKIVSAGAVDLDLNWLSLFSKSIEITKFNIKHAELSVIHSKNGKWNFESLKEIDWLKLLRSGDFTVKIHEIGISDSVLYFSDRSNKNDRLDRKYQDVRLTLSQVQNGRYRLVLSCISGSKGEEKFDLTLDYVKQPKDCSGRIKLQTIYLGQYWKHYLSAWLKPWSMKAKYLSVEIKFDYKEKKLLYSGKMEANGAAIVFGKKVVAKKAELGARLDAAGLTIDRLKGDLFGKQVDLKGKLKFTRPSSLLLQGNVANFIIECLVERTFSLQAAGQLHATAEASSLEVGIKLSDIKRQKGSLSISGKLGIKDIFAFFGKESKISLPIISAEVLPQEISGHIEVAGSLNGEVKKKAAWNGNLSLGFRDLSIKNIPRSDFNLDLNLQAGIFSAIIPNLELYNGSVSGELKMDIEKWGVGVKLRGLDMSLFGKTDPRLKGMKGTLDVNFAGMASWKDIRSIVGGGYCKIADASLRSAVIVKVIEEGINTLNKGFKMPDFKSLEGTFSLGGRQITLDDAYAKAPNMDLRIMGVGAFSGQTDFNVGIKFSRFGFVKTVRQVMFPFTIGFDMLVNAIHLKVSGNWPDLKQSTEINTIKWMDVFFNPKVKFEPDKYSLEKIWR